MKKTAFISAVLGTLCLIGTADAIAGDVKVYGLVDMGFSLTQVSGHGEGAKDDEWNLSMKSGMRNSSRFGLKGSEDLGNGYKVSYVLESQFLADSGELQQSGTLWEREASLALSGPFGKLTVGRLGKLRSPVGTTGLCTTNNVNPFGNSMSSFVGGHKTVTAGDYFPHNNSIVYAAPKIGGAEFFAQYSFGDKSDAGSVDDNDRYMAVAGRYFAGPLKATVIVDTINKAHNHDRSRQPTTVNAAVNYDFGVVQPFVYLQYFKSSPLNTVGQYMKAAGTYDGVGGMFTLRAPLGGGLAKAGVGLMKAEAADDSRKNDVTRISFSVGYDYKLSKTFDLYADAGWIQQKSDTAKSQTDSTLRGFELLVGCVKFF